MVLENDLVEKIKPGDRVQVTGVFRAKASTMFNSPSFQTCLVATGIKSLQSDRERPVLDEADIKNIKKIAKDKDVFDILG